ncbi:hypothetical protein KIPB_007053, partial [Kipferlia bialata]|eukprot:g7053.t1
MSSLTELVRRKTADPNFDPFGLKKKSAEEVAAIR